jgi:hypothetical protein
MSERLTNKWTPDLESAYGESGKKGREGELFVKEAILSWGWEVQDNESDYAQQVSGQDLLIRKPTWANFYSIDVKNNLTKFGSFAVDTNENGWLFKPTKTSHRIWHVNTETGWMAWYGRDEMKVYIKENNLYNTGLVTIAAKDKLPFISRSRYEYTNRSNK